MEQREGSWQGRGSSSASIGTWELLSPAAGERGKRESKQVLSRNRDHNPFFSMQHLGVTEECWCLEARLAVGAERSSGSTAENRRHCRIPETVEESQRCM